MIISPRTTLSGSVSSCEVLNNPWGAGVKLPPDVPRAESRSTMPPAPLAKREEFVPLAVAKFLAWTVCGWALVM
jgi:hypothetical protein